MLHRVHGHTTDLGPAVALGLVLVVGTASLQHGLVDSASASNNADHCPVGRGDNLLGATRQLHPGPLGVGVVGNDCGVVARGTGELAAVSGLLLKIADNGTLGHVPNGQLGLLTTVHKLASVHTLSGNE